MMDQAPNLTDVVVLASDHSMNGSVDLHDQRLSDFLNDVRQVVIELQNATVARLNVPGKPFGRHPSAVVPKSNIVVAFEMGEKKAPGTRRFYRYVNKDRYPVFIAAEGIEVRGMIHAIGKLDLHALLSGREAKFIPITNAVVSFSASERFLIRKDTVLINVNQIRFIAQAEAESGETPAAGAAPNPE